MQNINQAKLLSQIEPTSVWIASSVLKNKNRKDIREFLAKSVTEGDTKTFVLTDSFRELRIFHNFFIDEASEVRDATGRYECIRVVHFNMLKKIYPMLITKKIS